MIKEANLARLTVLYKKLKIKQCLTNQHLWFSNECFKFKVIPKQIGMIIKCSSSAAVKAKNAVVITWLKEGKKKHFTIRANGIVQLKAIHDELVFILHPTKLDSFYNDIEQIINLEKKNLRDNLGNFVILKLNSLINQQSLMCFLVILFMIELFMFLILRLVVWKIVVK